MDEFPDDLNKLACKKLIDDYHVNLLRTFRKEIYDKIIKDTTYGHKTSVLEFSAQTNTKDRFTIAKELLERFGSVEVEFKRTGPILQETYPVKDTIGNL